MKLSMLAHRLLAEYHEDREEVVRQLRVFAALAVEYHEDEAAKHRKQYRKEKRKWCKKERGFAYKLSGAADNMDAAEAAAKEDVARFSTIGHLLGEIAEEIA